MVNRLQCVRGISLHSAMVLATEIVDWRRFERPAQLARYLGLISREDSSGDRTRLGSITKAGNTHCRHVLVQAAWSYRHRPRRASIWSVANTASPGGGDACVEGAAALASAIRPSERSEAATDRGRRRRPGTRWLSVGGHARSRSVGRRMNALVVVRRVASRHDGRALSTAVCRPCRQQSRDSRA
jgi:hypothetical protein